MKTEKLITGVELLTALALAFDPEDPEVPDFTPEPEQLKELRSNTCEFLQNTLGEREMLNYASEYGEPGYTTPESGIILLSNWNLTDRLLGDILDWLGIETEWYDEWEVVNDKAWRSQPDSYGWTQSIHLTNDGEWMTPDDSVEDWIDEMKDEPTMALPEWITQAQLEELGWQRVDERYEHGFFPGQNDLPKPIYDKLIKRDDVESVVFRICDKGQFDIKFEAYILPREIPEGEDE